VVSRDRYTMISCENRYGRGRAEVGGKERTIEEIAKNLDELALDIFLAEQPLPYKSEALRMCDRMGL